MPRPPKTKAPLSYRTWLAVDLGTSLVSIQVTGAVGTTEQASLFKRLAAHFHEQRKPHAVPRKTILHRCSRYCDAKITFEGWFDPRHVAPLMAALQAQRNADDPALEAVRRASWLKRCRAADAARVAAPQ